MCKRLYALSFLETPTQHAGGSGEQLSVGDEMEACGDQAAAASNQLCFKSMEEPTGNLVISNIEWYNWQGQTEVT